MLSTLWNDGSVYKAHLISGFGKPKSRPVNIMAKSPNYAESQTTVCTIDSAVCTPSRLVEHDLMAQFSQQE